MLVERELLSTLELSRATGATLRQLDYWARTGVVRPVIEAEGSGSARRWGPAAVEACRILVAVSRLWPMNKRRLVVELLDAGELELGPGVSLVLKRLPNFGQIAAAV